MAPRRGHARDEFRLASGSSGAGATRIVELSERAEVAKLHLEDAVLPLAPEVSLFSDASDMAIAAVIRNGPDEIVSWSKPTSTDLSIFVREALGFWMGITAVRTQFLRKMGTWRCLGAAIDNQNLIAALHKGHSRNETINGILRHVYALLFEERIALSTAGVPSDKMLADFPSRGKDLPEDWKTYFENLASRSLPFFRPPNTFLAKIRRQKLDSSQAARVDRHRMKESDQTT